MVQKQCLACGQYFLPCPQVPNQCFCSAPACQKERRRRWQREKLKADPDYQGNQNRAQQAWIERNPDYWLLRKGERISKQRHFVSFTDVRAEV